MFSPIVPQENVWEAFIEYAAMLEASQLLCEVGVPIYDVVDDAVAVDDVELV